MPSTPDTNLFMNNLPAIDPANQTQSFRVSQDMLPAHIVHQSHLEATLVGIKVGTDAKLPTNGTQYGAYYATDTNRFYLWTGSAWDAFQHVATGVAASRPSSGTYAGQQYFATDTFAFSIWTGSAWKSTTLS